MKTCALPDCPNPVTSRHPRARYCSSAHKQAAWKLRSGYRVLGRQRTSQRRKTRDGRGVRLYVTVREAQIMVTGTTPPSVVTKLAAKLKPPAPLPGQIDLIEALAEVEAERIAT
jgi:hypothetical protein